MRGLWLIGVLATVLPAQLISFAAGAPGAAVAPAPSPDPSGARGAAVTTGTTGATGATGPSGTLPPGAPAPARHYGYRPIGCVRRGPEVAYRSGPARKVVALSFDDGPAAITPAFVRMLASRHVPATFFVVGGQVTPAFSATLHTELEDGDALGDHTFTHPYLTRIADVRGQLERTLKAIHAESGYTPCVFRPPYGAYDTSVTTAAGSLGLATVLWNVDPADYTQPGVGAIVARVLAQVRPGSIVLSHDGGGPRGETLAAYPRIIAVLRARGYEFRTVPQLLGFTTIYRRCRLLCGDAAVSLEHVPPGSVIE